MATFTDTDKARLDALYKKAGGKAFGSVAFLRPSEPLPSEQSIYANTVRLQSIPATPPAASTATIKKWYPAAEGGDGLVVFSRDRSVADGTKWVALPQHNPAFSAGSASAATVASILKGFITEVKGKLYLPLFYDGNDQWIPGESDALPTLDPDSGVLTFAVGRAETGNTPQQSIKMKAYQDLGQTLADYLASTGDTSGVDLVSIYKAKRDAP